MHKYTGQLKVADNYYINGNWYADFEVDQAIAELKNELEAVKKLADHWAGLAKGLQLDLMRTRGVTVTLSR